MQYGSISVSPTILDGDYGHNPWPLSSCGCQFIYSVAAIIRLGRSGNYTALSIGQAVGVYSRRTEINIKLLNNSTKHTPNDT